MAGLVESYLDYPQQLSEYGLQALECAKILGKSYSLNLILRKLGSGLKPSIESIKARKMLDDAIEGHFSFDAACKLENPAYVTPEFVDEFKEVFQRCKDANFKSEQESKEPNVALKDMKNVLDGIQKYGLNFRWYKDNIGQTQIRERDIAEILKTQNPENIKVFIDGCSQESKEKFPVAILGLAKLDMELAEAKGVAAFVNLITDSGDTIKSFGSRFTDSTLSGTVRDLKEKGVKDFSGATQLLKTFRDLGVTFSHRLMADYLCVKDNDYDSAINYIKLADKYSKELYVDEEEQKQFLRMVFNLFNENRDYKKSIKYLTELKETGILEELKDKFYSLSDILNKIDDDKLERLKLYHQIGINSSSVTNKYLTEDKYAPELVKKQIEELLSTLKERNQLQDVDDQLLWQIVTNDCDVLEIVQTLMNTPDQSMNEKIDTMCRNRTIQYLHYRLDSKNKPIYEKWYKEKPENISISDIIKIVKNCSQKYGGESILKLADDLMYSKDCKFPKEHIGDLIEDLKAGECVNFARELCFEHYPKLSAEKIKDITMYTHDDNIELAKKLCFDEKLKEVSPKILMCTRKANLNLATRFCYEDIDLPVETINAILESCYTEEQSSFIEKLCYDKERNFPKEYIKNVSKSLNFENLQLAQKLCFDTQNNFPPEFIGDILKYTNENNREFAEKLCYDKELNFPKELIGATIDVYHPANDDLANELIYNKALNFSNELIIDILSQCKYRKRTNFARELCTNKELNFPKEHIASVIKFLSDDNYSIADELCTNKKLDFPKEEITNVLQYTDENTKDFAKKLCVDKEYNVPPKYVAPILKYLSCNSKDKNKIEQILSDEKMRNWMIQNIELGLDMSTIMHLEKTQTKLNRESEQAEIKAQKAEEKAVRQAEKQNEVIAAKSDDIERAEKILVDMGIHPKMAPNYIKLCQENGIVDSLKLSAVCELARVNVPFKEFKNIFNIAVGSPLSNMNGQFRIDLIKDIVKLVESGVNDIKLATNLAATINMTDIELHSRLNPNIRTDMANRLDALDNDVKTQLINSGFDLDAIKEKALKKPKVRNINQDLAPKNPIKLRTLDSIVGVEKVVLNKFKQEVPQETWANPEAFKKWAEDKLESIINTQNDFELKEDFKATGQFAHYNNARKEGIKNWYKYLTEESNYKDDVFVHLLVMDGITRKMKPNNAVTPPAVSHESFESTYNALLQENTKVSFSDIYAKQTKAKAIQKYSKGMQFVDGIEGQWVTVPRSQRGEPNYDENVAMVQALAEGSSWCLRFENAHGYLQGGNLHYFLDKNGNAQVAINETDGKITQIQKRYNQNSTVHVSYYTVIEEWAEKNGYTGLENSRNAAKEAKPEFDELRTTLAKLMAEGNYLEVFKILGINATVQDDGTYSIDRYKPIYKPQYTLFDLGLDENKLMSNVSEIRSGVSLQGSSLTELPKLRQVTGKLSFDDCSIGDLRSLESIAGQKIYWDK